MTCPDCHEPTITTPNGTHLNPTKSRIGRYLPDGTETTPNDLRQGVRAHHLHYCPPGATNTTPTTEQDALF